MWMVRSDAGKYFNEFQEVGCVAIGWNDLGDVKLNESKESVMARLAGLGGHTKPGTLQSWASQILRFLNEIKVGDSVVTYDPSRRIYAVGEITSDALFDKKRFDGEFPDRYFDDVMAYLGMKVEEFHELCDKFRSPHLWGKNEKGEWQLRHNVWGGGLND